MTNKLAKFKGALATITPAERAKRIVHALLAGRNARTAGEYRADLKDFAVWLEVADAEVAAFELCQLLPGDANALVLEYRAHLLGKKLSPATVNRRLAALRSMVKMARVTGVIGWALEVPSVPSQKYRDTRGPKREVIERMIDIAASRGDPKGKRDTAILHLLFYSALRRGEVASLDINHVDFEIKTLDILGKGRMQRSKVTASDLTLESIANWIGVHPHKSGALFVSLASNGWGKRLSSIGLYKAVRLYGGLCGKDVHPHSLRHTAITEALIVSNGNITEVQGFSRHKNPATVMLYNDARVDVGGKITELLSRKRNTES